MIIPDVTLNNIGRITAEIEKHFIALRQEVDLLREFALSRGEMADAIWEKHGSLVEIRYDTRTSGSLEGISTDNPDGTFGATTKYGINLRKKKKRKK